MRLVLDTNVLIAAFVARGVCHELLEHCQRTHHLVSSEFILGEFEATLVRKFTIAAEGARSARRLIEAESEVVEPRALGSRVCRDPDDDLVLATAISGSCVCIVTGDNDLLSLEEFEGIHIVSPSTFWSFEASPR